MQAVAAAGDEALGYAGASLREMTRVAGANPAVWADIFVENGDLIAEALVAHRDALGDVERALRDRDRAFFENWIARIAQSRSRMLEYAYRTDAQRLNRIRIRIPDKPGHLARITQTLGAAGINIEDFELRHVSPEYGGVVVILIAGGDNAELARTLLRREGYSAAAREEVLGGARRELPLRRRGRLRRNDRKTRYYRIPTPMQTTLADIGSADDGFAQRDRDGLRARPGAELRHRPLRVGAHRVGRERRASSRSRHRSRPRRAAEELRAHARTAPCADPCFPACERGSEHRIDVEAAAGDRVDCAGEIVERGILEREAAGSGVERIGHEAAVGDA